MAINSDSTNFINAMTGTSIEGWELLDKESEAILDTWNDSQAAIQLLSNCLLGLISADDPDDRELFIQVADQVYQAGLNGDSIFISTGDHLFRLLMKYYGSPHDAYQLGLISTQPGQYEYSDAVWFELHDGHITDYHCPTGVSIESLAIMLNMCFTDYTHRPESVIANELLIGSGITYQIATFGQEMAAAGSALDGQDIADIAHTKLEEAKSLPVKIKTALVSAAISGPSALSAMISSFFETQKGKASSPDDFTWNFTNDVVFKQFAPGAILSATSQILTTAAFLVAGCSKVLAAIFGVVGAITSFIGKAITVATETIAGTKFTLNSGQQHFFDFVLSRGVLNSSWKSALMPLSDYLPDCFVINLKEFGSVLLIHTVRGTDGTIDNYEYEEHLTCDYDFMTNVTGITQGIGYDYAGTKWKWFSFPNAVNYKVMPYVNNVTDGWNGSLYVGPVSGSSSAPLNLHFDDFDPDPWYAPLDYSLIDRVKGIFSDEINHSCYRRLLTGLIIRGLKLLESANFMPGSTFSTRILMLCDTYDVNASQKSSIISSMFWAFNAIADMIFEVGSYSDSSFVMRSTPHYDTTVSDQMLQHISFLFNGIPYTGTGTTGLKLNSWDSGTVSGAISLVLSSSVTIPALFIATSADIRNYVFPRKISRIWPKKAAIELPDSLWSAFVTGLFIDALVTIAVVAVTTVAIIATVKVRQKRAQLQAKTEAAWYAYTDGGDYPALSKDAWKNYSRTRMKYNALSAMTGGTTLSLGLYDDGSNSSGLVSGVISRLYEQQTEDEASSDTRASAINSNIETRASAASVAEVKDDTNSIYQKLHLVSDDLDNDFSDLNDKVDNLDYSTITDIETLLNSMHLSTTTDVANIRSDVASVSANVDGKYELILRKIVG